jgi:signal transduction histidine kinase
MNVARDIEDKAASSAPDPSAARAPEPAAGTAATWRERFNRLRFGLPAKLLMLTAAFVMIAEVLIFLPSVSNYRVSWLNERLTAAYLAALAAEAAPGGEVPSSLRAELLLTAQVKAVASRRNGQRRVVVPVDNNMIINAHYDLRQTPETWQDSISYRLDQIGDAIAVFFAPDNRTIRVLGRIGDDTDPDDLIEIVMPEAPLKAALVSYAQNILVVSVIISIITAALVYFALSALLVQPMMRITRNMLQFSENPEDPERIIVPSQRTDEVGTAERELAGMQRQLAVLLLQKNRLAQLGLAVSKVNHDLRNMLANAQLISDRLTSVPDPTVQRFAPKLIASLDRAINFCTASLNFGRAVEAAPHRELIRLGPLVEEVGEALGLPREGEIAWHIDIDDRLRIDADKDHLFRILNNLCRNAMQAIEGQGEGVSGNIWVKAWRDGRKVFVEVRDDGPGVPRKAREHLFEAFKGSARIGGTGLGLTIANELVAGHGGTLSLLDTDEGAAFQFDVPDRVV